MKERGVSEKKEVSLIRGRGPIKYGRDTEKGRGHQQSKKLSVQGQGILISL